MTKAMLFIDGTWLYCNTPKLGLAQGKSDYHLDFGKLPGALVECIERQMGGGARVDLVRTYLFGSYAANCDPRDDDARQRRLDFFARLREDYHYELEIFPINFFGRRLKRADRDPADTFEPREKCVDIALATTVLYYAAIPHAYDIALLVIGDQDFKPVLQAARKLGKRVALASIKGSCAPELCDARDEARVRDFDVVWFDDLASRLELRYDRHLLTCESPMHKGPREVWTTFHPRRGQQFFCETCREEFSRLRNGRTGESEFAGKPGQDMHGTVIKKVAERGFGFIHAADGKDYFFHLADLAPGLDFDTVQEGMPVIFAIKREATAERGGTAQNVRREEELLR